MRALIAAACVWLAATVVSAQESDGIASTGILTDTDFFRLVTCGAPPGGSCLGPVPRWDKPTVTLALATGEEPIPRGLEARLRAAMSNAVAQINGAGAAIRVVLTDQPKADITVRPTTLAEGSRLQDVPGFSGRGIMGVGYMTLWWDDRLHITEAVILISTTISNRDLTSVVLEEVMQSLGILYDIENPAYEGVSILSQNSNATTTIQGQDAALLRWLYPPTR